MDGVTQIRRLLIANRGEIAVRIARAARDLGIVALGIYSEADARSHHLDFMDDAVCIGPAPAAQSYLDIERVLAAARTLRADAVHPGYGFLSERAAFARAVRDAGLIFVGPSPDAIAAMGDKIEAKRRAREHGVPVVPGYDGAEQDVAAMRAQAELIGTPLLVKASAGGGGRGMRVVNDLAAFDEAFASAQREALAAFGDATILLERYVARPRHIEFQIIADEHGTTLHLGERECSIQRRHQKIVEEAPSPALDDTLRERMGAAAIRTAQSVGYTNAGTVEFLLAEDREFYFLEMNARLQVEHPVTELVHGIDLVKLQLEIAAGGKLRIAQSDVKAHGSAIEVRLNAEDPANEYLPAAGIITRFDAPQAPGIRLDTGVTAGSEISSYYDSMFAKLIVWGRDRRAAVDRLTTALDAFVIDGVPTNLPLLANIAREPDFRAARTTTAYLTEHPDLSQPDSAPARRAALLLALAAVLVDERGWRAAGVGIPVRLLDQRQTISVYGSRDGEQTWCLQGDLEARLRIEATGDRIAVTCDGERFGGRAHVDANGVAIECAGRSLRFSFAPAPAPDAETASAGGGIGAIVSPMPGRIVRVEVGAGDAVRERDLLVVLEAMKMEHRIEAPRDGVVKRVDARAGALVSGGATLVELEA